MNATALIEQQHREVESLFESLESGKPSAKTLEQLAASLTAHAMIEEQLFYPAAMKTNKDLVLESYEEHDLMAYALKRLMATEPTDESFPARLKAVKEVVEQHVQEEEQELLPSVSEALSAEELETLGQQMEERFQELMEAGYEGALAARKAKRSADGHRAKGAPAKAPAAAGKVAASTGKGTASAKKKTGPAHGRAA